MLPFEFAKEIKQSLPQGFQNKIKNFSTSSSIKGTKVHCLFEATIKSVLYSSPISFELKFPTNIPLNQYKDIIIKNLVETYKDFTDNITSCPDTTIYFLEEKYSKNLDNLIGIDLMS